MRTLTLNAMRQADHKLTVRLRYDVAPGPRQIVVVFQEEASQPRSGPPSDSFPTLNVGAWPEGLSLRREDIYGDDGILELPRGRMQGNPHLTAEESQGIATGIDDLRIVSKYIMRNKLKPNSPAAFQPERLELIDRVHDNMRAIQARQRTQMWEA